MLTITTMEENTLECLSSQGDYCWLPREKLIRSLIDTLHVQTKTDGEGRDQTPSGFSHWPYELFMALGLSLRSIIYPIPIKHPRAKGQRHKQNYFKAGYVSEEQDLFREIGVLKNKRAHAWCSGEYGVIVFEIFISSKNLIYNSILLYADNKATVPLLQRKVVRILEPILQTFLDLLLLCYKKFKLSQ